MGGIAKGLLSAPQGSETLVERLLRVSDEALGAHPTVLVGEASAYAALGIEVLEDLPAGVGPLGGLCALLDAGVRRETGAVIALACDMPFVTKELIARLAAHAPDAALVAPRPGGIWQPLTARYAPAPALSAARDALSNGERALYRVIERLGAGAVELPLEPADAPLLRDWDEPSDLDRP
jgi:molybdenum cofactor guanylyltransferase